MAPERAIADSASYREVGAASVGTDDPAATGDEVAAIIGARRRLRRRRRLDICATDIGAQDADQALQTSWIDDMECREDDGAIVVAVREELLVDDEGEVAQIDNLIRISGHGDRHPVNCKPLNTRMRAKSDAGSAADVRS